MLGTKVLVLLISLAIGSIGGVTGATISGTLHAVYGPTHGPISPAKSPPYVPPQIPHMPVNGFPYPGPVGPVTVEPQPAPSNGTATYGPTPIYNPVSGPEPAYQPADAR